MCLGVPGRIESMVDGHDDQLAVVELSGRHVRVNIGMLDQAVCPGDWVVVHMGFAMETMRADEAAELLAEMDMTAMLHEAVGDTDEGTLKTPR